MFETVHIAEILLVMQDPTEVLTVVLLQIQVFYNVMLHQNIKLLDTEHEGTSSLRNAGNSHTASHRHISEEQNCAVNTPKLA
jgi:hypothetical protein